MAYTKKTLDNIIQEATLLTVYPTLEDAIDNKDEIRSYMKRYSDFDIVYGDYMDYMTTRKREIKVETQSGEKMSQAELDQLIKVIHDNR